MARRKKNENPKQGKWSIDSIKKAVEAVKIKKISIRRAAEQFYVPKSTLERRVNGKRQVDDPPSKPTVTAYAMAEMLKIKHPFSKTKAKAGYDWYEGFMRRHPQLAIRKPEGLSAARGMMLNKHVVTSYFQLLEDTMNKLKLFYKGSQIYNVDETGINTVHTPAKIIGLRGTRAIHSKTSGDRGENVTVVICASASGSYIPPMIIFKGQRLNRGLVANAPPGALFATSKSSFIDRELFEHWFKYHFMKYLPSHRPVLLIMDGHSSHISLEILQLAKENEIEILCLPPHITSELQPLDKCVFKPLKTEYNKACMQFLKENPGRIVTRYDFCGLFTTAYYKVCTMLNAASAFRATGIFFPFNPSIIPEEVFGPSIVSHLPSQEGDCKPEETKASDQESTCIEAESDLTSTSADCTVPCASGDVLSSLLKVPSFEKQRKIPTSKKSRRITSARCLTEDEVIKEIEDKENEKEQNRIEKENRKKLRVIKKLNKKDGKSEKLKRKKRKDKAEAEEEKEADFCNYCHGYYYDDDSDDEDWVKCSDQGCNRWFHESCTSCFGKEVDAFKCDAHKTV
ncbi:uncharacterized protein [Magallana gigas]|uniref:uncharacterized protein n=1 Tax=Magallana gigas TaxID=29159 RepID=UPI003342385F